MVVVCVWLTGVCGVDTTRARRGNTQARRFEARATRLHRLRVLRGVEREHLCPLRPVLVQSLPAVREDAHDSVLGVQEGATVRRLSRRASAAH